jgi:hypothetical protein
MRLVGAVVPGSAVVAESAVVPGNANGAPGLGKFVAPGKSVCTMIPTILPNARIFPGIVQLIRNCWRWMRGMGCGRAGEASGKG